MERYAWSGPDDSGGKIYDIEYAAMVLGSISVWTLRKHIAQGRVPVTRIGRRVFIDAQEVERIRREGLPSLKVKPKGGKTHSEVNSNDAGTKSCK